MTPAVALGRFNALSRRTRIVLGVGVAVAVALLALVAALGRDTRIALFATPLHAEQRAEVEEHLAAWNVSYLATADNVRVDAGRRNDLLLRLAVAGVPHDHVAGSGEALAKAGALTPQSVLDAQERAGLAGDLALALRGIAGITDARVIVAPARAGTYADEADAPATASVRLSLVPGTRFTAERAHAIRAFVADAVPGLSAERVAILDDRGDTLGAADAAPGASEVQAELQSALDAAFGAGAAIVRVRVERDDRASTTHDTRRAPYGQGTIARESSDERFASDKRRYAKVAANEERGTATHEERTEIAPGRIARISVAVVVDAARRVDLRAVRALAQATAGIDARRGDAVSVVAVAFAGNRPPVAPGGFPWLALLGIVPQIAALLVVVAIVGIGGKPVARVVGRLLERAETRAAAAAVAGAPPHQVRGALAGEPPHTAAAVISALPAATAAAVLELYPPDERAAIVRRLARERAPLLGELDPFAEAVPRRG